jgi:hypothetical protein
MHSSLPLTPPATPLAGGGGGPLRARVAVWSRQHEPPVVEHVDAPDPVSLVEGVFSRAAGRARVPVLALRELVENLVHARFSDALVSVLENGRVVRVSDTGPGIADKRLAMEPGFTTADEEIRRVVRGVGGGLPVAAAVMARRGGALELADNLGGGTVATLAAGAPAEGDDEDRGAAPEPGPSETARRLMALLMEVAPAQPARVAAELDLPLAECGRELVLLEHLDLVTRSTDGERSLTPDGERLLATLF